MANLAAAQRGGDCKAGGLAHLKRWRLWLHDCRSGAGEAGGGLQRNNCDRGRMTTKEHGTPRVVQRPREAGGGRGKWEAVAPQREESDEQGGPRPHAKRVGDSRASAVAADQREWPQRSGICTIQWSMQGSRYRFQNPIGPCHVGLLSSRNALLPPGLA